MITHRGAIAIDLFHILMTKHFTGTEPTTSGYIFKWSYFLFCHSFQNSLTRDHPSLMLITWIDVIHYFRIRTHPPFYPQNCNPIRICICLVVNSANLRIFKNLFITTHTRLWNCLKKAPATKLYVRTWPNPNWTELWLWVSPVRSIEELSTSSV